MLGLSRASPVSILKQRISRIADEMKANRITKVIAIVCLSLTAVALIITRHSPAMGYESSIYAATPLIFWVAFALSITSGIAIIVHQLYIRNEEHNLWIIGLTLILVSCTAILSLFIVRGYALWNAMADPATHLGGINNIVATGHIATWNFYPAAHIYAAEISSICGIDPIVLHKVIPLVFALLYISFMYLLAKSLLADKAAVILATVASLSLTLGWYIEFLPNGLANFVFPLALFLLIKSFTAGLWRWRALFIVMVFLLPVFHPVPSVALAVVLTAMPLAKALFDRTAKNRRRIADSTVKFSLVALAALLIWGSGWILSHSEVSAAVAQGLAPVSYYTEPSPLLSSPTTGDYPRPEPYTLETVPDPPRVSGNVYHFVRLIDDIRHGQEYGYSITKAFFTKYGGTLLYMLLALSAFPILWRRLRKQENVRNLVLLYGPLVSISVLIAVLFFTALPFDPQRFLTYILLICTIFVGFVLYELIKRAGTSQDSSRVSILAPILVAIVLLGAFASGVANVYKSPHNLHDNRQTIRAEIAGMDWLLNNKSYSLPISANYYQPPGRFADFLLTREEREQRQDIPWQNGIQLPPHFGYDKQHWLGEWYPTDTYLLVGERDRRIYLEVFPNLAKYRFYPQDFEWLEVDPTLDRLYCSNEFDVWLIRSQAVPAANSP